VGGLSLAQVRDVLAAIESHPQDVASVGTVHEALGRSTGPAHAGEPTRALAVLAQLGWAVWPESTAVRQLDTALSAAASVGLDPAPERIHAYGEAAMNVAVTDVGSVPADSAEATAAYVVLGTVLFEPVLLALRRLAQQQVYSTGAPDGATGPGSATGEGLRPAGRRPSPV
jgi:hypothetical protein